MKISVIIPARNAEVVLPRCLEAVGRSSNVPHEVIVVDDQSSDQTTEIAQNAGVKLLHTGVQSGPGAARNLGARHASGEVLLFIDADVVIRGDTLARVSTYFLEQHSVAAVFGSYDDEPSEPNFLSQYKNIQHHYVHQTANVEAKTFWAGCGAVRRDVFLELGGFDAKKYPRPSIEDIEFGYRLNQNGYRIALDKELCVTHLKRWTFRSHLHAEILLRALPWSKLMLERKEMLRDLNLTMTHRASAVLAWLMILLLPLVSFHYLFFVPLFLSFIAILVLNRGLYGFFLRHRGLSFLLRAIPFHLLHYLYSAGSFAFCWVQHTFQKTSSQRVTGATRPCP